MRYPVFPLWQVNSWVRRENVRRRYRYTTGPCPGTSASIIEQAIWGHNQMSGILVWISPCRLYLWSRQRRNLLNVRKSPARECRRPGSFCFRTDRLWYAPRQRERPKLPDQSFQLDMTHSQLGFRPGCGWFDKNQLKSLILAQIERWRHG
jgi:hypothetical protein